MLNHQNHRIQQQQQQQQQQHQNRQRLSVTFNLNQNHQPQQQHQQQNDSLNNNNNNNEINDDRNHNHIKDDDVLRRNSFNTIINNNDCTLLPTAKYPYYCLKDSDYYYGQVSNRRYSSESAAFNHYHSRNHGANAAIAANNVTANASSLANDKQSSLKSIISRAKSDILINTIGQIGPNSTASKISAVDNNRLTSNNTHPSNDIESKRTNATLKKLARYINVRPRLMVKQHKYQRLSIVWAYHVRPIKCHICTLNIYFYCYECLQCKLTGHKKCLQNISVTCPNKLMPPRLNVFGLEISDNNQISDVLYTCIAEIERRPIHTIRGIYKIEGNIEMIENLCLSFEFGSHLIDLSQSSPHDLASVVKHYLICISTPIFNDHIQKELITIGSEWPARKIPYTQSGITILVFELRRLVSYLSPTYRNNLAFLIYHFKRIVDRQHITEMTANSLAIIFAPIIFRDER